MLSPALGREEVIRAAKAQKILRDWSAIVGDEMASRSFPDRYDHGTVWVAVEGSAWAQELRMHKDQILQKLQERTNEVGLFQNLRFGVRPLPEPVEETPFKEPEVSKDEKRQLSIQEIAERRLKNWKDGEKST